jgi:hypothetical protein
MSTLLAIKLGDLRIKYSDDFAKAVVVELNLTVI